MRTGRLLQQRRRARWRTTSFAQSDSSCGDAGRWTGHRNADLATGCGGGREVHHRHRHHLRAVRIPGRAGQFRRHRHGSHPRRSPRTRASPSTSSRWASTPRCRRCRPTRSTASSPACRSPTSASRSSTSPTRTSSPACRWRCSKTDNDVKSYEDLQGQAGRGQERHRGRRRSPTPSRTSTASTIVSFADSVVDVRRGEDRKLGGGLRRLPGAGLRHHPGQRPQDRDAEGGGRQLRVRRQQGPERRTAEQVQRRA